MPWLVSATGAGLRHHTCLLVARAALPELQSGCAGRQRPLLHGLQQRKHLAIQQLRLHGGACAVAVA